MKREPSVFSAVKVLEPGECAILSSEKLYAARCAVSYLEVEYEQTYSVTQEADGRIIVTRIT